MATPDLCLTELILCIQHEVQSAVDYIAAQAAEPSELGASTAVMAVQSLRVRLPFDTTVLSTRARAPARLAASAAPAPPVEPAALRQALAQRKGLALDIGQPGGLATYLKLKVTPTPAGDAGAAPAAGSARAEIEISFAPMQRPD